MVIVEGAMDGGHARHKHFVFCAMIKCTVGDKLSTG